MMRQQVLIALVGTVAICVAWNAQAATIEMSIDGGPAVSVPNYVIVSPDPDAGKIAIGTPGQDYFLYMLGDNSLLLSGVLDPDPSMNIAVAATDGGAPSTFSISIILPFTSPMVNPSQVYDSLTGTVLNGTAAGGVTVTALAPPGGIPVDDDNDTELQVFTLSSDGTNWQNVGLDAGPTTVIPLAANATGNYGSFTQGYVPTIDGGPWTHMRADFNFQLTGGGDSFNFTSMKTLVPEPGTLALALMSLAFGCILRRRAGTR